MPSRLLLITDRRMTDQPLAEVVAAALAGGCRWLLVREKDLPQAELAALLAEIIELARPYGAAVAVSGDAEVAARSGADGVHLPHGYSVAAARAVVGPDARIGVSAHSLDEAQRAAASGVDYITLSPVFLTASKPGYGPALGLAELERVAALLPIPTVALGGITAATAGACLQHGAAGVAVMGTIMTAAAPDQAMREILTSLTPADRRAAGAETATTGYSPPRELHQPVSRDDLARSLSGASGSQPHG